MIEIRPLADGEVPLVEARLPLHRLDHAGPRVYLIAWDGAEPVAHGHGIANDAARAVYERAGYVDAGLPPERVEETILVRGEPLRVDDTLVHLEKRL